MAETAIAGDRHQAFERDSVPTAEYRAALLSLLGWHAIPVWGWGQRAAYEAFAMEGPSLDHWVRTTGLWAEEERHLWEWEQLVSMLTDEPGDDLVQRTIGDLAAATDAALEQWVDTVFLAVCIDGLGEHLVSTLRSSSYGPLRRHARRMVMYKRGQCADGCTSLDEIVRTGQVDAELLERRADVWLGLARRHAEVGTRLESGSGWVTWGIAEALDVDAAADQVTTRLRSHLGMAR